MSISRRAPQNETAAAEAQLVDTYIKEWKAWRLLVALMRARLAASMEQSSFDDLLAGTAGEDRRKLEQQWSRVDRKLRQTLEQFYSDRRDAAIRAAEVAAVQGQTAAPTREEVERRLIDRIDAELHGTAEPAQKGKAMYLRPTARDLNDFWVFDHRVLDSISAQDFTLAKGTGGITPKKALIGVGSALLVGLVALAALILNQPTKAQTTVGPSIMVGNSSRPLWSIRAMGIGDASWPIEFSLPGVPTAICVPKESIAQIKPGVTLTITSTEGLRTFVVESGLANPELLLKDCAAKPPVTIAEAAVQTVSLTTPLLVEPISVLAWAADVDPSAIPPGQMRVVVTWPEATYADGRLVLVDGTMVAPVAREPREQEMVVTYLIPAVGYAQSVGFILNRPGEVPSSLVLKIPAPVDRATWLRSQVTVALGTPKWEEQYGQIELVVEVTFTTSGIIEQTPVLSDRDVSVTQRGQAIPIAWTPPILQKNELTTSVVRLPLDPETKTAQITIVGWPYTLNW